MNEPYITGILIKMDY